MSDSKLEEAIKDWISLRCFHCGKLNPKDTVKCVYCCTVLKLKISKVAD